MNFFIKKNLSRTNTYNTVKQFVKFGIVGFSNTLIALLVYYLLIYIKVNYIVANTLGFIISVLNAYYWNSKYVFNSSSKGKLKTMLKTFMSYGITFLLSTVFLMVMVDYLNISKVIAPVLNLIVTIPLNFLLNKFWTFR